MDTNAAFSLLVKSLHDLCDVFNQKEFKPLLEADVTAYLYHRLLSNGCTLPSLYSETRVCGIGDERRKYDIVIGEVDTRFACMKPVLIAQVKCFQRWGQTPQQHRIRFEEIIGNDLESLKEISAAFPIGRVEVVTDFVFKAKTVGYLNGTWQKHTRRKVLKGLCKDNGVSLLWVRPNDKNHLELEQLTSMGVPLPENAGDEDKAQ